MGGADLLCDITNDQSIVQFKLSSSSFTCNQSIDHKKQSINLKQAIVHLLSPADPNHITTVMHKIEAENAELNIMEFGRAPHYAPYMSQSKVIHSVNVTRKVRTLTEGGT